jgi:hypothetical protein
VTLVINLNLYLLILSCMIFFINQVIIKAAQYNRSDRLMTQHGPCNSDRGMPRLWLRLDVPARHDPTQDVLGPCREGRSLTGFVPAGPVSQVSVLVLARHPNHWWVAHIRNISSVLLGKTNRQPIPVSTAQWFPPVQSGPVQ